jgi:hypothetical protein
VKLLPLIILLSFLGRAQTVTFDSLRSGLSFPPYCIYSDTTENAIYVGGQFIKAGGKYAMGIAKWDGENWDTLGCGFDLPSCDPNTLQPGITMGGPEVNKILKYRGNIYVSGALYKINGIYAGIAKFDGTNWISLDSSECRVYDMVVFNDKLYVASSLPYFGNDTLKLISVWNDTTWQAIDAPMADLDSCFYAFFGMEVYNGDLYAFGDVSCWLGYGSLYKLNGTQWQVLPGFETGINVTCLKTYKDKLIVGGAFTKAMGFPGNHVMAWDGSQWHDMDNGFEGSDAYSKGGPQSMQVLGDKLVVTSGYPIAGNKPIKHIQVWDGTKWCGYQANYQNIYATNTGIINDDLYVGYGIVPGLINGQDFNYITRLKIDSTNICSNGVGINESIANNLIKLFPNPVTDNLTLEYNLTTTSNFKFALYDVLGNIVYQEEKPAAYGYYHYPIPTQNLAQGLYIARIQLNGQTIAKKVLKQ